MKRNLFNATLFVLISLSTILFSSCDKEKDVVNSNIVGTWYVVKLVDVGCRNGKEDNEEYSDEDGEYLTFNSDGTGTSGDVDGDDDSFLWCLDDGNLTIAYDKGHGEYLTVKSLTKKEMVLYWISYYSHDYHDGIGDITYLANEKEEYDGYTIYLKKKK